ncbi:unnamed protein product [Rhizophagus irregularis]|nr:unnamed protein product [Rhizophagus irregularis]
MGLEENIPTIVMFGDQSSGKSSVLKHLTGGLPLTGIRTLSIVEIHFLQAEEPLRKISLRYIEDENHQPVSPREVEFAIITEFDEEEIEEKLCEAQRYIKNPSISDVQNTRLPPDSDELAFTKNAATSGIDTQCAYRLAREADPTGQRTVGVLTKMDRIVDYPNDDEKHLELATIVKGQGEHKLVNGTYVIRNPTNSENYVDPDELEKETIRALKQLRIWRDIPHDRYGLQFLTIKLSELHRNLRERSLI